jgi:hypothetical protein
MPRGWQIAPDKRACSQVRRPTILYRITAAEPTFGVRIRWLPNRLIGSIATHFEQVMPRGWSLAARGIVGELGRL